MENRENNGNLSDNESTREEALETCDSVRINFVREDMEIERMPLNDKRLHRNELFDVYIRYSDKRKEPLDLHERNYSEMSREVIKNSSLLAESDIYVSFSKRRMI